MTTFQRIVKYLAIAFAIYLIIIIIGVFFSIFAIIIGIEKWENNSKQEIIEHNMQEYYDVQSLDIKLGICKLKIEEGTQLKIETSNVSDKFKCELKNNTLKIEDNKMNKNIFKNIIPEVIIYIPKDYEFHKIDLELGINDTYINDINGEIINIDIGIGKTIIKNINGKNIEINGGAGETSIDNINVEKLNLDSGIGSMILNGKILSSGDITSGIGKLEINLYGQKENYEIKVERGLGEFKVDDEKIKEDKIIGNGSVKIKVEAGIGQTEINYIKPKDISSGIAA